MLHGQRDNPAIGYWPAHVCTVLTRTLLVSATERSDARIAAKVEALTQQFPTEEGTMNEKFQPGEEWFDDVQGHGFRAPVAPEQDVEGHGKYTSRQTQQTDENDIEGHGIRGPLVSEDDDVQGHGFRAPIAPEQDVEGHGRYTPRLTQPTQQAEQEDTEGHGLRGPLVPEDDDVEGHVRRA